MNGLVILYEGKKMSPNDITAIATFLNNFVEKDANGNTKIKICQYSTEEVAKLVLVDAAITSSTVPSKTNPELIAAIEYFCKVLHNEIESKCYGKAGDFENCQSVYNQAFRLCFADGMHPTNFRIALKTIVDADLKTAPEWAKKYGFDNKVLHVIKDLTGTLKSIGFKL